MAAVERAPEPHPSVLEAEGRVGRSPKDAAEELQQVAADMQVQPAAGAELPEAQDVAILRRDGRLTAEDEAALAAADELAKNAEGWATSYETLASCVLRYEP